MSEDDYARDLKRARELGRRTEHWSDRKRRMAFSGGIPPGVDRDAESLFVPKTPQPDENGPPDPLKSGPCDEPDSPRS